VHLVGFTIEIYHNAQYYKRQTGNIILLLPQVPYRVMFNFINIVLRITDTHEQFFESICINPYPANVENIVNS
jgi:hypothetical protein